MRTGGLRTQSIYHAPLFPHVTNTGDSWGRDYIHHKPTTNPNRIKGFMNYEFVIRHIKSKLKNALYALWGVGRCLQIMVETPPKKIGYFRFWFAALNRARKEAWEHYGNLLILATFVQCGLAANFVSKMLKGVDMDFWINFSPVILVVVGFPILLTISAYRIATKQCKLEEFQTIVPSQTSWRFDFFMVLIALLAILMVAIIGKQHFRIVALKTSSMPVAASVPAPKPLPDINIPPVIPTNQNSTSAASVMAINMAEFDTNNPVIDTNDASDELATLVSQKKAAEEARANADRTQREVEADKNWAIMSPIYRNCIETFYSLLEKSAADKGDSIAKTITYFSCIPKTVFVDLGETNIAEIRFKNETNIDFTIFLAVNDTDCNQRGLEIKCAAGELYIHHDGICLWNNCLTEIHIKEIKPLDDTAAAPLDHLQQVYQDVTDDLKLLRDAQIEYANANNR
jgi:hypothetical protein